MMILNTNRSLLISSSISVFDYHRIMETDDENAKERLKHEPRISFSRIIIG